MEPGQLSRRQRPAAVEIVGAGRQRGVAWHAENSHRQRCIRIDIGGADVQRDRAVLIATGVGHAERRRVDGPGDDDRHRLGRARAVVVLDGDVVGDGERLAGGEEIEIVVGSLEREADRARARNRAGRVGDRGRQRTRQHRSQPARQRGAARPDGREQARAHRVGIEVVDVGEGERTAGGVGRRRTGDAGDLGDRMRPRRICIKHGRGVRIDRDRDMLARARTEAVRILDR